MTKVIGKLERKQLPVTVLVLGADVAARLQAKLTVADAVVHRHAVDVDLAAVALGHVADVAARSAAVLQSSADAAAKSLDRTAR